MSKRSLGGDPAATIPKAKEILDVASKELKAFAPEYKIDNTRDRAKMRQIAEKTWMSVVTAADADRMRRGLPPSKNPGDVMSAFKAAGSRAKEAASAVFEGMHISCHYDDQSVSCTADRVQLGVRQAAKAIGELSKTPHRKRRR